VQRCNQEEAMQVLVNSNHSISVTSDL